VRLRYIAERHYHVDEQVPDLPCWEPERSFDGQTVVIVGGGPSLADVDLAVLAGHRFIAVNSACRIVRPIATEADYLLFQDNSWSVRFPDLIEDWPGVRITSNRHASARLGNAVRRIDVTKIAEQLRGFPDFVFASSGHVAACLATVMGARRVVLVGFDCRYVDGRSHGHADYTQSDEHAFWERFLPGWRGLAAVFERAGVEVVNATPLSAIDVFSFVSLGDALRV
jgi:hypothetical protein